MPAWLRSALDYVPDWLAFQMRASERPGCVIAISHRNRVVLERAFGHADLATGEPLTPRHRFRIASHSKSFTAAGILKLREQGKLKLDDPVGQFVDKLHRRVARSTIAQLLSHSAGLIRDGSDAGQFTERRPFFSADELRADLRSAPVIEPNTRFKYSNHGYGLLGLMIEAITGQAYAAWIRREIVEAAGLKETQPDMPLADGVPFARGHTGKLVLGRRLTIPGDFSTNAVAPAGGFVSTAADLARYFAQLSPEASKSVLSVASRREMVRRLWREPHTDLERYYGLGTISGTANGWDWFGHSGGLQGYLSQTRVFPAQELTVSVLTNSIDGWAGPWLDGVTHILQGFARRGAPSRQVKGWTGRWWSLWGAVDLVPMGDRVLVAVPGAWAPFANASELAIMGRSEGRIALAGAYGSHGEPIRCVRRKSGKIAELWLSATKLVPEDELAAEMTARYDPPAPPAKPRRRFQGRAEAEGRHPMTPEFLLTSLIVVLMPGTGVIYTLSCGLFQGRAASVAAAFGCTMGILPHMSASMLGLAALLHASALAFQAVKFAGVAYLLYLAWGMWRETGTLRVTEAEGADRGSGGLARVARRGFLINILNPKLSIFFLAFLPQFTPADAVSPLWTMAGHSAVFMLMTFVVFVLYGIFAALARERMSSPRVMRWLRRSFAGLFAALGVRLAFAER